MASTPKKSRIAAANRSLFVSTGYKPHQFLFHLGQLIYVVVGRFNNQVNVHVRRFNASEESPEKEYPTKEGVYMTVAQWSLFSDFFHSDDHIDQVKSGSRQLTYSGLTLEFLDNGGVSFKRDPKANGTEPNIRITDDQFRKLIDR